MMKLVERAFEIAKGEVGVKELPGAKDNPRIEEFLKAVGFNDEMTLHDEIPWCSAFVNWCVQKAGGKGTKSGMARSWLNWGNEVKEPKPGDIVIFSRGTKKWTGHVAFVVEVGTLFIKCLGGNQGDSVSYEHYRKSKVLGYRTSRD
jgi:uncharacterized protein (TIGR02594 family)